MKHTTETNAILDIVAQQYKVAPALLRKPISTLVGNPAREALVHAFYVLKLRGIPYSVIGEITSNHKGTISRTTEREIGGRLDTARVHTQMHLADQRKHQDVLEAVRMWEMQQAEQESYFEGEEGIVEELPESEEQVSQPEASPAAESPILPTEPSTEKVENPLFQKVISQEAKVIPIGDFAHSPSAFSSDFALPEDDGVPEPKTPKNVGTQPSPFPNPTDVSAQVVTPNSNTAQFATNTAKNVLPLVIVPFTQIDETEVGELEESNRLPDGALEKVEDQNKKNAQKIKSDIELQVSLVNDPLARALGSAGVGSNPLLELAIALLIMVGMLAMSTFSIRSSNQHLLERMKREHRKQQKMQQQKEMAQ